MTMAKFMNELAPSIWPEDKRIGVFNDKQLDMVLYLFSQIVSFIHSFMLNIKN